MLAPSQLYPHLPRKVSSWTCQDVQTWFKANQIAINPNFNFEQQGLDGLGFQQISSSYLYNQLGIHSNIIIKNILEWIQQDLEEFDQYVDQNVYENCSLLTQKQPKQAHNQCSFKQKQNVSFNHLPQRVHPKHLQAIVPLINVQKWKSKQQKSHSHQQHRQKMVQQSAPHSSRFLGDIKYTQSSYQACSAYLIFHFIKQNNQECQQKSVTLRQPGVIGRSHEHLVCFNNRSVSRNHAQISLVGNQYYLRDLNSKYSTFIEIGVDLETPLQEQHFLAFDDYYIQVTNIRVYKQKNKQCFDLKVTAFLEQKSQVRTYYAKKQVTIGRKQKDITFNYPGIFNNHAKISLVNDQLFLIKQQGECYRKLKKMEYYHIEKKQNVRFGLQKVAIELCHEMKPVINYKPYLQSEQ